MKGKNEFGEKKSVMTAAKKLRMEDSE